MSASISPARSSAEPSETPWERGARGRFLSLAAARAIAQAIGIVWFLLAARRLSPTQFGELAVGLTFFAVFAGLGDLGTTRTIVRHVSADPGSLWSNYRRSMTVRLAGGLGIGALTVAVLWPLDTGVDLVVVGLAAGTAAASGATENAYAALRSVGRVRTETVLLISERLAFLVVGTVVLLRGGGATSVMLIYLVTNAISALVSGVAVARARSRSAVAAPAGSFHDRHARYTAAQFTLATLTPRLSPLVLSFTASAATVGVFVAAQRPVEALALLTISAASPVMPIVRARLAANRAGEAERATVSTLTAALLAVAPVVAWALARPGDILQLLFGEARGHDADLVVRLLAITTVTWSLRGVTDMVLLAEDRARRAFAVTAVGAGVTLVGAAILSVDRGAVGAALATVIGEIVMTVLLLRWMSVLRSRAALLGFGRFLAATAATFVILALSPGGLGLALVVVGASVSICLALSFRSLRGLDR